MKNQNSQPETIGFMMKQHKLYNHAWNVFETDIWCEQCNNKHVSLKQVSSKQVYSNHVSALIWTQLKGTLSRVDMRSSIHSVLDLSRSNAIMEISVSWRILHIFCIKSSFFLFFIFLQ